MATCANCGETNGLMHCKTCKQVSYCSKACQKKDFKDHKKVCRFMATSYADGATWSDALSSLRQMPPVLTVSPSKTVARFFNTAEIRMALLSLLPPKDLLKAQGVCRSWYHTISLENVLQQRLFLAPGPGKLVLAVHEGSDSKFAMAIAPRNKKQLDHAEMAKCPAMSGGGPLHLVNTASGSTEEKQAAELDQAKIPIILNPFFTKLCPQQPTNMTNKPYITVSIANQTTSWRRMQLTSPPMLQLDMSVWYTNSSGKGNQMRPSTGKIATGVTLGHVADLLATLPSRHTLHWMSLDGHARWARSADAPAPDHGGGDNDAIPGVYVNPSNGIAFPGAF